MNFFRRMFPSKYENIATNTDFWNWFSANQKKIWKAIHNGEKIEEVFFDKMMSKLNQIKDGIYFLTGMYDHRTAELILTADTNIKNIVFVEDLIKSAPDIDNWKFTALKPEVNISKFQIKMENHTFSADNLSFFATHEDNYPDEIDLTIVYDHFIETEKDLIINGVYLYINNLLGELSSATIIDHLQIKGNSQEQVELIPIVKLKDYLSWRESEFEQKYQNKRYSAQKDNWGSFEAALSNGKPYFAIANTTVLEWDHKASHPWVLKIEIHYDGKDNHGLPNSEDSSLMNAFEEELNKVLIDTEGYLNIGRETADNLREIFFACREFRDSSRITHETISKYSDKLKIDYHIYKDKYWQTFDRFKHE
ncbi:DUF695 domain-containing protein [Chryseobacterium gwangjuense]|uniref:DUF695 domain-containing protein n=1 Tax=Chryseobacterium gwangjuense TaxID=1069980 RepID=UPI001E5C04E9|nr:DUF695 domain-containing protein [Chryseobacterium gwangjuense]MCE3074379.1 DUF695 domain-containing protein [Chryseobacterium gwangjuense]